MATAAGGTVASLGETLIGKGHINKRDIAESVVSNVVSAGIGTGVGKIIEKGATKLTAKVANKYASSVVRQAFRKEVKSEIKRTLGTTSGKYAKQLANRMVNRRVSVNRQFYSHLVLFGKMPLITLYKQQLAWQQEKCHLQCFHMVIQFIKGLLLMAKDFNIYTYPNLLAELI